MPIDFKSWKIIYKMGKINSNQEKLWLKRKNQKRPKEKVLKKLGFLEEKLEE